MRRSTKHTIDELYAQASSERRCLCALKGNERRLIYRHIDDGYLVVLWNGVFAVKEEWEKLSPCEQTRRIVKSLAIDHPMWVFCAATAATMFDLEVSSLVLRPLQVATPWNHVGRSDGRIAWRLLEDQDTECVEGVLVTSFEQTIVDCLIELDFSEALAIADSALRVRGMKRAGLIKLIEAHRDVEGWQRALDVARWASPLAANGGESIARAVMIEQGFMLPKLQAEIPNLIEGGVCYADFEWDLPDGTKVIGELDGLDKYIDPQMTEGKSAVCVMSDERRRESRIGAAGMRVMRFSFAEVRDVDKFCQLLEAFGIPRGPARPQGRRGFARAIP